MVGRTRFYNEIDDAEFSNRNNSINTRLFANDKGINRKQLA